MASVNKVMLIGHLGADPDVRAFASGGRIATLRLATSESWTDKATGQRKERTEWHSVVVQNEALVGVAEKYLRKGAKLFVEGQLRTRKWQDRDGVDRYTTEVVVGAFRGDLVLLDRREGNRPPPPAEDSWDGQPRATAPTASPGAHDLDDDVPF